MHIPYWLVHQNAVQQRQRGDFSNQVKVLYRFYCDFLPSNFNLGLYREFHETALADLQLENRTGIDYLISYYDTLLTNTRLVMNDAVARDVIDLSRGEGERAMFQKLRFAWRNGATNLKTRKRLGGLLTEEEKTEFDKGG